MKFIAVCVVLVHLAGALSTNEDATNAMATKAMEKVFARSEKAHEQSMAAIMRSMSVSKAVTVLRKSNVSAASLVQITDALQGIRGRKHLRKQPKGYSGVDGARKMLNDMIYESMEKYDAEIAKCTEYYSSQCAAMEVCRGEIAAANYVAANSRALILDAQSCINRCEVDIPTRKLELKQHNLKCEHELHEMNERLKVLLADIDVMTTILEMTDCQSAFMLTQTLHIKRCVDPCTKKSFLEFDQTGLNAKMAKLRPRSRELISSTFADLFEGVKSLETSEFLQQAPIINKTKFNNPPVPRTEVPADPCTDPDAGAPSANDKAAAKCSITHSPQCYKLQERFLLIQSGIQDERDDLQEKIQETKTHCEEVTKTLETQIANDEQMLDNCQTKLASATEKEAEAGEKGRTTAAENKQLNDDLIKQMKSCSDNYINFETEICALKKIRGELYKLKGGGHSAFFQDCEVSKWDPEECTKDCGGGEQQLSRSVMTHPEGGAKCLPLAAERSCNNQPCPVDCHLSAWHGWSKCSAECGGGVQQRLREVTQAMKFNGKPCGATSETRQCEAEACEKDCDLSEWTKWTACSKDCDGGTQKRTKFVDHEPEGAGECPDQWSEKRLEYKQCNMFRCLTTESGDCSAYTSDSKFYTCDTHPPCCEGYQAMGIGDDSIQCLPVGWASEPSYTHKCPYVDEPKSCPKPLDVVLLLDGSGSLGKSGWEESLKAAEMFVDAFRVSEDEDGESKANVAVLLFSGPPTWSGVYKCTGKTTEDINMETDCKMKWVSHFTRKMAPLKTKISELEWPQGSTLTSLALMTAKTELGLGRKDEESVVVVITDGRPLSYRKTWLASRSVRKMARLLWVPVTQSAPLRFLKRCATRRWEENIVVVDNFDELGTPDVITQIMADICPDKEQNLQYKKL